MNLSEKERKQIYEEEKAKEFAKLNAGPVIGEQQKKKKGKPFQIIFILIILFMVIGALGDKDASSEQTANSSSVNIEDFKTKENQDAVLKFEKEIFALEEKAKPIFDQYSEVMGGIGTKYSIYDAYQAAENAETAAKYIQTNSNSVSVPDSLPKEIKELLDGASLDFSTSYYVKGEALKSAKKFLDSQKPSDLQAYKDSISQSDQQTISFASKLLEAKTLVGIDLKSE